MPSPSTSSFSSALASPSEGTKPEAFLVHLKPKSGQTSKPKFLLLLSLPDGSTEALATSPDTNTETLAHEASGEADSNVVPEIEESARQSTQQKLTQFDDDGYEEQQKETPAAAVKSAPATSYSAAGGSGSAALAAPAYSVPAQQAKGYSAPAQQAKGYSAPAKQAAYSAPAQQQAYEAPAAQQMAYSAPAKQEAYSAPAAQQQEYSAPVQQQQDHVAQHHELHGEPVEPGHDAQRHEQEHHDQHHEQLHMAAPAYSAPAKQEAYSAPAKQEAYSAPAKQEAYSAPAQQQAYEAPAAQQQAYSAPAVDCSKCCGASGSGSSAATPAYSAPAYSAPATKGGRSGATAAAPAPYPTGGFGGYGNSHTSSPAGGYGSLAMRLAAKGIAPPTARDVERPEALKQKISPALKGRQLNADTKAPKSPSFLVRRTPSKTAPATKGRSGGQVALLPVALYRKS